MMRRYFYCLSALLITLGTLPTFAQIGPGALLVEGNIGIRKNGLNVNGSSSGPDFVGRTSLITINPVGGIFLKDDLVIGVSGNYQYQNYRSDHTRDELATNYDFLTKGISVAPFVRRYFFLNDNLAVSGELQTGYSRWKSSSAQINHNNPTYETTYLSNATVNGVFASFRPGLSYFFTPWFALRASINVFRYDLWKQKEETSNTSRFSHGGQNHEQTSTGSSTAITHQAHFGFSLSQFDVGTSILLFR